MLWKLLRIASPLAIALLAALAAACGDDDDDAGGEATATASANPTLAGPQTQPLPLQELRSQPVEPQDGAIEIVAADTLFQENYLRVPEGQSVVIRVTNSDTNAHNLRIAGIDGVYGTEDDAVTSPDTIVPGAVGELTFAPPLPGAYTFRCDFHPDQMGGQVVVGNATPGTDATPVPTDTPAGSEETPLEGEAGEAATTPYIE